MEIYLYLISSSLVELYKHVLTVPAASHKGLSVRVLSVASKLKSILFIIITIVLRFYTQVCFFRGEVFFSTRFDLKT